MTGASRGFYNVNNNDDMDKGIDDNAPLADRHRAALLTKTLQQINYQAWVGRVLCFRWGIFVHTVIYLAFFVHYLRARYQSV